MNRTYDNITINIENDKIRCRYAYPFYTIREWQLSLLNDRIVFLEKKKETIFLIENIKEFQFEVGGVGRFAQSESATAYVILKDNPEPQFLFSLIVNQKESALSSDTMAFSFCEQIFKFISEKYDIPSGYKISIDTKEKANKIGLVFFLLIVVMIVIWFSLSHST
ncbi:MAG: hypothetical protein M3O71_13445 [Bacteroidota bacterium]|nr:hypothetical protein [Bacteroidota bacterium]